MINESDLPPPLKSVVACRPPGISHSPYFRPFLDPHLVLPQIAESVLIHEAFVDAKVQLCKSDFSCVVAAEPAKRWHGVVFLTDTKPMEMEVRPVEADLQDYVKIGQGAVGSDEKASPEHRVDPPNPDVDAVSFGLRIVFHEGASLSKRTTSRLPAPVLKCSRLAA